MWCATFNPSSYFGIGKVCIIFSVTINRSPPIEEIWTKVICSSIHIFHINNIN